jgi:hypothetical protein
MKAGDRASSAAAKVNKTDEDRSRPTGAMPAVLAKLHRAGELNVV